MHFSPNALITWSLLERNVSDAGEAPNGDIVRLCEFVIKLVGYKRKKQLWKCRLSVHEPTRCSSWWDFGSKKLLIFPLEEDQRIFSYLQFMVFGDCTFGVFFNIS